MVFRARELNNSHSLDLSLYLRLGLLELWKVWQHFTVANSTNVVKL
ncbi:hypothetical protein SOVF_165910 [Spinacia oleracea]|nr:hypothetical protein SOVF_165910 [Spinacia oleracea]